MREIKRTNFVPRWLERCPELGAFPDFVGVPPEEPMAVRDASVILDVHCDSDNSQPPSVRLTEQLNRLVVLELSGPHRELTLSVDDLLEALRRVSGG